MKKMELKLKNNYMAKRAFIKINPNKKHGGGQATDGQATDVSSWVASNVEPQFELWK